MVEVMVFEGRGKRFVDQLTRIFERQLFLFLEICIRVFNQEIKMQIIFSVVLFC